jgi:hypothetical protein
MCPVHGQQLPGLLEQSVHGEVVQRIVPVRRNVRELQRIMHLSSCQEPRLADWTVQAHTVLWTYQLEPGVREL